MKGGDEPILILLHLGGHHENAVCSDLVEASHALLGTSVAQDHRGQRCPIFSEQLHVALSSVIGLCGFDYDEARIAPNAANEISRTMEKMACRFVAPHAYDRGGYTRSADRLQNESFISGTGADKKKK